eukprot:3164079-Karenia_brevis.AAC.1
MMTMMMMMMMMSMVMMMMILMTMTILIMIMMKVTMVMMMTCIGSRAWNTCRHFFSRVVFAPARIQQRSIQQLRQY